MSKKCKILVVLSLVVTGCVTTPANTGDRSSKPSAQNADCQLTTSTGKLADAAIFRNVALVGPKNLAINKSDATGGVMVAFVVSSKTPKAKDFTISEKVIVKVNGENYKELTKKKLGKDYDAQIVVEEVEKFNDLFEADIVPPANAQSKVVRMKILGDDIAMDAHLTMDIGVGWAKKTERHAFDIPSACLFRME